jgi:hypothetical protein
MAQNKGACQRLSASKMPFFPFFAAFRPKTIQKNNRKAR